ncbi:MAG: SAM-dependent methyltransferase [Nitrospirota bacterium]
MRSLKNVLLREDHVCPWWLAYTFDNPLRRFLHDPVALLSPYVREGMTVADIGCGMGYFSLALASLAGGSGAVIAVDIQQEMLAITARRAERAGLARRIRPVLAASDDIAVREPVDFVLAFWMAHETGDVPRFFRQVFTALKPGGMMLVAEPKLHVGSQRFLEVMDAARSAGFRMVDAPPVRWSRTMLLGKD